MKVKVILCTLYLSSLYIFSSWKGRFGESTRQICFVITSDNKGWQRNLGSWSWNCSRSQFLSSKGDFDKFFAWRGEHSDWWIVKQDYYCLWMHWLHAWYTMHGTHWRPILTVKAFKVANISLFISNEHASYFLSNNNVIGTIQKLRRKKFISKSNQWRALSPGWLCVYQYRPPTYNNRLTSGQGSLVPGDGDTAN